MKQAVTNQFSEDTVSIVRFDRDMHLKNEEQKPIGMEIEKRKYLRKPCFLMVDFVIQGRAYRDFVINLSRGGLLIGYRQPLMPRLGLAMSIVLPGRKPLKVCGEIVRNSKGGVGVKFYKEAPLIV